VQHRDAEKGMRRHGGVVVVTHCHLAEEMILRCSFGGGEELKPVSPVSIDPKEGSRRSGKSSSDAIRRVYIATRGPHLDDMRRDPFQYQPLLLEERR